MPRPSPSHPTTTGQSPGRQRIGTRMRFSTRKDFIIQVAKRAKEEWESFHLEHPDIDEETFRQAQRFCLKQWFLEQGTVLADLPAFEQAEKHFECEVQERAAHIQAIAEMMADPI